MSGPAVFVMTAEHGFAFLAATPRRDGRTDRSAAPPAWPTESAMLNQARMIRGGNLAGTSEKGPSRIPRRQL